MRTAGTVGDSIVDGPGLRFAVFVQGCSHHCPGCQNPHTHDPAGGHEVDPESLFSMLDDPLLDGLTLSGGEPLEQPEACTELARAARERGLNVWVYTGYTFETLLDQADPARLELLRSADVLVDGPFLLEERSLDVPWRGSRNQRLLDLPQSLERGCAVLWVDPRVDRLAQFTPPDT